VEKDANTNAREVISAPSKIDNDRGMASTAANSETDSTVRYSSMLSAHCHDDDDSTVSSVVHHGIV